ncbi:MAG: RipA family octameric membrane protein [Paraclostridium sp.]
MSERKLFFDSAESVSLRRTLTNKLFVCINMAYILTIIFMDKTSVLHTIIMLFLNCLGLYSSFIWYQLILQYKLQNGVKYKLLSTAEDDSISTNYFNLEWEVSKTMKGYLPISDLELRLITATSIFYVVYPIANLIELIYAHWN